MLTDIYWAFAETGPVSCTFPVLSLRSQRNTVSKVKLELSLFGQERVYITQPRTQLVSGGTCGQNRVCLMPRRLLLPSLSLTLSSGEGPTIKALLSVPTLPCFHYITMPCSKHNKATTRYERRQKGVFINEPSFKTYGRTHGHSAPRK